jgi:hypothetical protein
MTYKEYKKNLKSIEQKYAVEIKTIYDELESIDHALKRKAISEAEAKDKQEKLHGYLDMLKGCEKRSLERLKINFARQDAPAQIGDLIWAMTKQGTKLLKVTDIKLAAFDYPMLKYFGVQLTLKGVPSKIQKEYPQGGIYQKNITSVNGEPYIYKARE